jgi:hypothetical protein
MTTPSWRPVPFKNQNQDNAGLVKVEANQAASWNLILPFVAGPRLLRFTIKDKDDKGAAAPTKWHVNANEECGADGLAKSGARSNALVTSAPAGALVGKIGGSTADLPDASTASGGPYAGKKVFAVGSYAVVPLASTDSGPLFLTMNDLPDAFSTHSGALWVLVEEAPL